METTHPANLSAAADPVTLPTHAALNADFDVRGLCTGLAGILSFVAEQVDTCKGCQQVQPDHNACNIAPRICCTTINGMSDTSVCMPSCLISLDIGSS